MKKTDDLEKFEKKAIFEREIMPAGCWPLKGIFLFFGFKKSIFFLHFLKAHVFENVYVKGFV